MNNRTWILLMISLIIWGSLKDRGFTTQLSQVVVTEGNYGPGSNNVSVISNKQRSFGRVILTLQKLLGVVILIQ